MIIFHCHLATKNGSKFHLKTFDGSTIVMYPFFGAGRGGQEKLFNLQFANGKFLF